MRMRVARIVMPVAKMRMTVIVGMLVHPELFYPLALASAAFCALITQFDTSRPRFH